MNISLLFRKKTPTLNRRRQVVEPARTSGVVREAWWLALVVVGLYLAAILFTYNRNDPSWSHSASDGAAIHNAGGAVGAWLADILLYLFGFSAWWWVVLAFYAIWLRYQLMEVVAGSERRLLMFNFLGFGTLLIA